MNWPPSTSVPTTQPPPTTTTSPSTPSSPVSTTSTVETTEVTSFTPPTTPPSVCTEIEGMMNPSLTPNIKVNNNEDVDDIRPNGNMLKVPDSTANIEVDLGKQTQLGLFKFLKPEESNIQTFEVFLVKTVGGNEEPYKTRKSYSGSDIVVFDANTYAQKVIIKVTSKVNEDADYSLEMELRACYLTGTTPSGTSASTPSVTTSVVEETTTTSAPTTTLSETCENPEILEYEDTNSGILEISTKNNKFGQEPKNSLRGSANKWSPNTNGSEIDYIINGQNAQFVDGTFTTVNVEKITLLLIDKTGNILRSETKSYQNKDVANSFTLNFNMQQATRLRLILTPRTDGTETPSLSDVEIKCCLLPGETTSTIQTTPPQPPTTVTETTVPTTQPPTTTGTSPVSTPSVGQTPSVTTAVVTHSTGETTPLSQTTPPPPPTEVTTTKVTTGSTSTIPHTTAVPTTTAEVTSPSSQTTGATSAPTTTVSSTTAEETTTSSQTTAPTTPGTSSAPTTTAVSTPTEATTTPSPTIAPTSQPTITPFTTVVTEVSSTSGTSTTGAPTTTMNWPPSTTSVPTTQPPTTTTTSPTTTPSVGQTPSVTTTLPTQSTGETTIISETTPPPPPPPVTTTEVTTGSTSTVSHTTAVPTTTAEETSPSSQTTGTTPAPPTTVSSTTTKETTTSSQTTAPTTPGLSSVPSTTTVSTPSEATITSQTTTTTGAPTTTMNWPTATAETTVPTTQPLTTPGTSPTSTPSVGQTPSVTTAIVTHSTESTTTLSTAVSTPAVSSTPPTTPTAICDNPKTIDYEGRDDKDLQIITRNNKVGEEPKNTLKGSSTFWTPNTDGSEIDYIVNGPTSNVIFVDGTFETVNIERITISLIDASGQIISSETKSYPNKDTTNTFALNFNMAEATLLRLFVVPKSDGSVTPSLSNVQIKVCYLPASTTVFTTTSVSQESTTAATPTGTTLSTPTEEITSPVVTTPSGTTPISTETIPTLTPTIVTSPSVSITGSSTITTVTVTLSTTTPGVCTFTREAFYDNFGYYQTDMVGYIEKDNIEGLTSESEEVRIGDTLEMGTVVITANCSNCSCVEGGRIECVIGTCQYCKYTEWSYWTDCSKTCDNGAKSRTRSLVNIDPRCTEIKQTVDCNTQLCQLTTTTPYCETWSEWSQCSSNDCTMGVRTREQRCPDLKFEEEPCTSDNCISSTPACVPPLVLKECVQQCPGTCKAYRMGTCIEPDDCQPGCGCPAGEVMDDNGECVKETDCPCYTLDGVVVLENFTIPGGKCEECKCSMGSLSCYDLPDCCEWEVWGSWGECSASCEDGIRSRHRKLLKGELPDCGQDMETEWCQQPVPLPDACVQCVVNGIPYTIGQTIEDSGDECTTCYCLSTGQYCAPDTSKNVNGDWSQWTEWGTCSKTCHGGQRVRTRNCNDPVPMCQGLTCPGNNTEVEDCNLDISCCVLSQWTEWGECTVTCGEGNQLRQRDYVTSTDETQCPPADKVDSRPCNVGNCECVYDEWTAWSTCTATCGLGYKDRRKDLLEPNEHCNETITEVIGCYEGDCFCDQNHERWTNYSYCQQTCANRHQPLSDLCTEVQQGCICEEGYFLNYNNVCVQEKDCVCNTSLGLKENGETWTNPDNKCEQCECVDSEIKCYRKCAEVKSCPLGEVLVQASDNDCCYRCEKAPDTCKLYTKTEVLERDGCVSVGNITYNYCAGGCGDSVNKPMLLPEGGNYVQAMSKDCKCCTGNIQSYTTVKVKCAGSDQEMDARLPVINQCECNMCATTEYEEQQNAATNYIARRKR